jgi:hypothetical protein
MGGRAGVPRALWGFEHRGRSMTPDRQAPDVLCFDPHGVVLKLLGRTA